MLNLTAAATIFVLLHFFPSTPWRQPAISRLGEGAYLGLFSLLSLASIFWLTNAFLGAGYGAKFWAMPEGWLWAKAVLLLFALLLIIGGVSTPNPSMAGAVRTVDVQNAGKGIFAITRHPLMWGIAIWAFTHGLSQATLRGIVFFGALAIVALLGAWLQERRKRQEIGPAWIAFQEKTSFLPFVAMLKGRARFKFQELGLWRIALAVAAWAAILHFHASLFGAQPLP